MPNILKTTKEFNFVYDLYKDSFEQNCSPSFHNLLWQIIVNETYTDRLIAFTPAIREGHTEIVIAEIDKDGYYPTSVGFSESIQYNQASDICKSLNEMVFGLTNKLAMLIIASTMRPRDEKKG